MRHLILALHSSQSWCRQIALGAAKYAQGVADWNPVLMDHAAIEQKLRSGEGLGDWAGVVGIFYPEHHKLLKMLGRWGVTVVNTASEPHEEPILTICNDEVETGRMAARYFLSEGHRNFAYLGFRDRFFSAKRLEGFAAELAKAGIAQVENTPAAVGDALNDWIGRLPAPCAIFGANDVRARHALGACAAVDWAVPEEAAVLGVDDDELFCHMNHVATSSVQPAWQGIGFRAAEVLDTISRDPMAFALDYREEIVPQGIAVRQSTDQLAVADPVVAKALAFIKQNSEKSLKVPEVVRRSGVSRRTLERRFEVSLRSSIRAAILNVRLDRARQLLMESYLSVGEIAARTGFAMHSRFDEAFKQRFGSTPSAVRKGRGS